MRSTFFCVFVAALICCFINLKAQDPSFSQFESNKLYFNPAYCGSNHCEPEASVTYRYQWPLQTSLQTSKFATSKIDANFPIAYKFSGIGFGLGGIFVSDNEGEAFLRKNTVGLVLGGNCRFGELINHSPTRKSLDNWGLNVGCQLSYIQYSLDWNKLRFSNQYDPVDGFKDGSVNQLSNNSVHFLPDIAVGGIITHWMNNVYLKKIQLGCAVHHINSPNISFYDKGNLPSRFVSHICARTRFFKPVFAVEYQNNMWTSVLNINSMLNTKRGDLLFGLGTRRWRNFDAIIITAAYKQSVGLHSLSVYVNVDMTVSGLYGSGEAWECGLIYNYNRCNKISAVGCPRSKWEKRCSEDSYFGIKNIREKQIQNNSPKNGISNE